MEFLGNNIEGHIVLPSPCHCSWCSEYICNKHTPRNNVTLYFWSTEDYIKGFFCSRQCIRNAEADDFFGEVYRKGQLERDFNNATQCFITTAICQNENKPDDCEELVLLRSFRDSYMMQDEVRKLDVASYYQLAPQIVQKIDSKESSDFYTMLNRKWLQPAISCIKMGEQQEAYMLYAEMMHFLIAKYKDELHI